MSKTVTMKDIALLEILKAYRGLKAVHGEDCPSSQFPLSTRCNCSASLLAAPAASLNLGIELATALDFFPEGSL